MMGSALKLRPYQRQAIDAVRHEWARGVTDTLLVAATGAGKTQIFLALLDEMLTDGRRGLILAHRQELIDQPLQRIADFFPHWLLRTGVVMAERDDADRQMVIASVQTLARPQRIAAVLGHGPIDYVVTDEAHHACAPQYLKVFDTLRAANPDLRHLGVTATPLRADGDGLAKVYQTTAAKFGIKELVPRWLVPPRWLAISTAVSLAGVETSGGDYVQRQLATVWETEGCWDVVVQSHQTYADGRKAIAFTPSVEGAYKLAAAFSEVGIPAVAADGTTSREDRAALLRDFRAGRYQVLCNCALFTEGLDVPEVSCIHQVRPTKSDGLYVQMIGRALRPMPGKETALILDYMPAETRNVAMLGDILGVPKDVVKAGKETAPGEVLGGFTFDGQVKLLKGSPLELVHRQLDYLNASPFVWTRRDEWLILGLGPDSTRVERTLAISPTGRTGRQKLYMIRKEVEGYQTVEPVMEGDFDRLSEQAQAIAEEYGNGALVAKARSWRSQPATDGQRDYLRRLAKGRLKETDRLNKGEAAELITFYAAHRALQRAGYWGG